MSPHGTPNRYTNGGCRCADCREAVRVYQAGRRRLQAYGRWDGEVPAGPARQRLQELHDQGAGVNHLARITGLSRSNIGSLLAGQRDTIRATTARAILSAQFASTVGPRTYLPALGTRRRVQALHRLGWSVAEVAAAGGISVQSVRRAGHGDVRVTASTRDGVVRAYDGLWNRRPADTEWSRSMVRRASAAGWPPPLAWDDEHLEDPAAEPAQWQVAS